MRLGTRLVEPLYRFSDIRFMFRRFEDHGDDNLGRAIFVLDAPSPQDVKRLTFQHRFLAKGANENDTQNVFMEFVAGMSRCPLRNEFHMQYVHFNDGTYDIPLPALHVDCERREISVLWKSLLNSYVNEIAKVMKFWGINIYRV